jgi:dTDP-L-rhamnose 4-epimerase
VTGTVLVTGGGGFIGSHVVDRLVAAGRKVRVLDSFEPQVHGDGVGHRNPVAEYLVGSVLDRALVEESLSGVGAVVHLAAQVGVGQSMYDLTRYVRDNCLGTAVLLEAIAEQRETISTLVVASSMSIYGEGLYACNACGLNDVDVTRSREDLEAREWEPRCSRCGSPAVPLPTPESKRLACDSVYAVSKRDQEEMCLVLGRAYGIRTIALRFFNVYGPRQSLSNPYTGVAAIFAGRLLNGRRPLVFEDGLQSRDFVHVHDVADAVVQAIDAHGVDNVALNIGTGIPTSVLDVARVLAEELVVDCEPQIDGRFRSGDIRHCYSDISAARSAFGYEPKVLFADGMRDLIGWIRDESPDATDRTEASTAELMTRGLVR